MPYTINMCSKADQVKGQGVGSATEEAIRLIQSGIGEAFDVVVNRLLFADITHIHSINPSFFLATPFLKRHGKVVGSVHFLPETVETSLNLPFPIKKAFYWYMLTLYKQMDALVTVNPYFIQRLSHYGVDPSRVRYIPNFVDDRLFYPVSSEEKKRLRKQYQLHPSKFTVVCAGQLQTRKGVFDFVKCARRLPDMQFVWAGGFSFGAITDGHAPIKKLLAHPPDNVRFLGMIDRENMNDVYNLGDVMFLPSFEELFPMTILEAMNCRIPILVRDLEIYEDILFDYAIKKPDMQAFVDTLKRLANDRDYYLFAREKAWEGHLFYNRDHVLSMWRQFYRDIAKDLERDRAKNKRLPVKRARFAPVKPPLCSAGHTKHRAARHQSCSYERSTYES